MEEYTSKHNNQHEELLTQYNEYDECNCLGGIGEETSDHQLTISLTNNITIFTFKPIINNNPDDIILQITNWQHSNYNEHNNTTIKSNINTFCPLQFYVNRNKFLGITARSVLSIEFDITNIENVENIHLDSNDEQYNKNAPNLHNLFIEYFSNYSLLLIDELIDIKVFVIDGANDDINVRRLQSNIWEDDDISVQIIVYTKSAEKARLARIDMEQSQLLSVDSWNEHLRNIISNKTGETHITFENINYKLLTPDEVPEQIADFEDPDGQPVTLAFWLVVLIAMAAIIFSVVIITFIVYYYCKHKGGNDSMIYQKPEVTEDQAISEYDNSECNEEEGELEENIHIAAVNVNINTNELYELNINQKLTVNKSRKILPELNSEMNDTNFRLDPLIKYHLPKPDGGISASGRDRDIIPIFPGASQISSQNGNDSSAISNTVNDIVHSDIDTIDTFSIHTTTAWHFDIDSNLSTDEYIQNIISKVCSNNKTQLISHSELEIDYMIGKGHFGKVYVGKYHGNKVAIKEFPDLICINGRHNNSYNGSENGAMKYFGKNIIQRKKSGYSSLSNEDTFEDEEEELNALTTDDEQLDDIQSNDNVNVIIRNVSNSVKSDDSIQQNKNEKIAIQVWLISLIFFLDTMGWCVYMTMFALYLIEVYDITDALVIGYITLALASVYVFANVVAFTFLANRIGIYCTSTIGLFLFSISMAIAPLMPGLWSLLAVVVFGWGLGNGLVFPAMSSMGADYATQKTRGMVLGIVNMGQNLGLIIGPMMHGALYAINVDYMYYVSAGFIFSAFLIQLFMVLYWKETRISLNEMREEKRKSELVVDPKTWKYKKEKIKYKDYVKLGKGFGILLQQRNYQWVTYFDKLFEILDGYFPHLSADNWDRYYNDITFVKQHALETKHDWTTSRLGPNRLYM
eukprot:177398_1